ncbi:MAG: hypothetical protein HYW48_04760 [Deltaproteobacteria bacterium]|nr:hypothetical protein [Deltaproteobacteria bacterium]
MRTLFPTFSLSLLACACPLLAQGEAERPLAPRGFLLPWHHVNIVAEIIRSSSDILEDGRKKLAEATFSNPLTLDDFLRKSKGSSRVLPNQKQWAREILVTDQLKVGTQLLALQPVLCSLGDQFLVFLNVNDPETQKLRWSSHQSFPKASLAEHLSSALEKLAADMKKALSLPVAASSTALQLDLRPRFLQTRKDQGSSYCLANILAQQLIQEGFTVLPPLGREIHMALHDLFFRDLKMFRTTRHLLLEWTFQNLMTFPQSPLFQIRMAEAVFAKFAEGLSPAPWTIAREGDKFRIAWPPDFVKLLQQEASSLRRSDFPSVLKIVGAWAYLDRGRAWGLKMNDRLVANGSEAEIKGHVVGFYGTEQNLKNALGHPVHEGAILFVRKGQDKVSLGQNYTFDSTKFPTEIP